MGKAHCALASVVYLSALGIAGVARSEECEGLYEYYGEPYCFTDDITSFLVRDVRCCATGAIISPLLACTEVLFDHNTCNSPPDPVCTFEVPPCGGPSDEEKRKRKNPSDCADKCCPPEAGVLQGDPYDVAAEYSYLAETDLLIKGANGPIEAIRILSADDEAWLIERGADGKPVLADTPKPFGSSRTSADSLQWSHSYHSFVFEGESIYVRKPSGHMVKFGGCTPTSSPCLATAISDGNGERLYIRLEPPKYVLIEANGDRLEYGEQWSGPNAGDKYYLSRKANAADETISTVTYESPRGRQGEYLANCPSAALGCVASGTPYIRELAGPGGSKVKFYYVSVFRAIEGQGVVQELAVSQIRVQAFSQAEHVVVSYAYDGDQAGHLTSIKYGQPEAPARSIRMQYTVPSSGTPGSLKVFAEVPGTSSEYLVTSHTYGARDLEAARLAAEPEVLRIWFPDPEPAPYQVNTARAEDGTIHDGYGAASGLFLVTHYDSLTFPGRSGPLLKGEYTDCGKHPVCDHGGVKYLYDMKTRKKATKDKAGHWSVAEIKDSTEGFAETKSMKAGANDETGTGALLHERYTYTYRDLIGSGATPTRQLLASRLKPGLFTIGEGRPDVGTFYDYDQKGRVTKEIRNGYSGNGSAARYIGVFYSRGTMGQAEDLDISGPCETSGVSAPGCSSPTYPLTSIRKENGRITEVTRYPSASKELKTTYRAFDAFGNHLEAVDENGNVISFEYDATGGNLTKITAPSGAETHFSYQNGT